MHRTVDSVADTDWPNVPGLGRVDLCSLLDQLDASQWWTPVELRLHQFQQLARVARHAYEHTSFYRARLEAAGLTGGSLSAQTIEESWSSVPLLSRRDIQLAGESLHAVLVPPSHGAVTTIATSGSTGQPVSVRKTALEALFWRALTIRDHLWQEREFGQSLAAIRFTQAKHALPPHGVRSRDWGGATRQFVQTGPAYLLNVRATIAEQADWLARIRPGYILGYPSAMRTLADYFSDRGCQLDNLRGIRTFGEIVEPECRQACRTAFGVGVSDTYSSQEVGYIALQCPKHEHHHVQSEGLLVEVLDDENRPCNAGEVGRVVITSLHNFATPLLRYDIGDYAEVGHPCDCGRGLPVLNRILGRQRNILRLPDGQRRWPVFGQGKAPDNLPPFFQFQIIQRSLQEVELKVVRSAPFTDAEAETVKLYLRQALEHPFDVTIRYVDSIQRSPSGKFEDFVSDLT